MAQVELRLGALTVLSGKQYIINSLHVVTGGSVLVTSLVLTLRDWENLSYAEIADVLGVPLGTVKSRLFSVREILKQQLERK